MRGKLILGQALHYTLSFLKRACLSILLIAILSIQVNSAHSQVYLNQVWEVYSGNPTSDSWSSSVIDAAGNVYTTGHTVTQGQGTNILTTKVDNSGTTIWSIEFNGTANLDDYGADIILDNSGNVFVAGTVTETSNLDYILIKYSSTGQLLWSTSFNGASNGDDIPSDLILDNNGNIIVTGGVGLDQTDSDYGTVKFDANGTISWSKYYDYTNLEDAATMVGIDPQNRIVVSGASASSIGNYDIASLRYDTLGNQVGNIQRSSSGVGIDLPTSMGQDNNGNIYICGYHAISTTDYEMVLIRLDSNLGLDWDIQSNITPRDDRWMDLEIDAAGNCIVTGYSEIQSDNYEAVTRKYNSSGTMEWERTFQSHKGPSTKGSNIAIDLNGDLNVAGDMIVNGNKDIFVIQYDPNGETNWTTDFDSYYQGDDLVIDISGDAVGNLYITGYSEGDSIENYMTLKLSASDREVTTVIDTTDNEEYVAKELVVRFHENYVNTNVVDNKKTQHGTLDEFLLSSAVDTINAKLSNYTAQQITCYKVYTRMTTADSISVDRWGQEIEMEPLWSTLVLKFPDGIESTGEEKTLDSIFNSMSSIVKYSEINHICELHDIPDDPILDIDDDQSSLVPTQTYPNAHINMDPAWDIETGKTHIKVGIYDSGIRWSHADFRTDNTGTFQGSKIEGGWNYVTNNHVSTTWTQDAWGHGTPVAGIIGAVRNNTVGIAGIAGGDESSGNTGVQLFDMHIVKQNGKFVPDDVIANAVVEGASWNPNTGFGYGLHITNHSYGGEKSKSVRLDAHYARFRNKVVAVASKGNGGLSGSVYPADYNEEWMLSVGSSGDDGEFAEININSDFTPNYGGNIDVVAPGEDDNIKTTKNDGNYENFGGTSASAPHVTGLAALLLSNYNWLGDDPQNLTPEDVEHLIEMSVDDLVSLPASSGYDNYTGYGRINAATTLENISKPNHTIHHYCASGTSSSLISTNLVSIPNHVFGLPGGFYNVEKYKVSVAIPLNLNSSDVAVDAWPLLSASNLLYPNLTTEHRYANVESWDQNQIVLSGFVYHVISTITGAQVNKWCPFDLNATSKLCGSIYTDKGWPTEVKEVEETGGLKIYPNPTNNILYLEQIDTDISHTNVRITNILGEVVLDRSIETEDSKQKVDVTGLSPGMYIVEVKSENDDVHVSKIIVE